MVERASPGPPLELFARKLVAGWFAWGHEVALSLVDQSDAELAFAFGRAMPPKSAKDFTILYDSDRS
jgi:N6-adenosine-specific RNA methylase IME4